MAALLTLALGIGANAAMFTVIYAVLIEPLPYPSSDRLMFLAARNPTGAAISFSYPDVLDWQQQTRAFEKLAAYQSFGLHCNRLPRDAASSGASRFSSLLFHP
jgi:hypothetical protein